MKKEDLEDLIPPGTKISLFIDDKLLEELTEIARYSLIGNDTLITSVLEEFVQNYKKG